MKRARQQEASERSERGKQSSERGGRRRAESSAVDGAVVADAGPTPIRTMVAGSRFGVEVGDTDEPAERAANRFATQLLRGSRHAGDGPVVDPDADTDGSTLGRQRRAVPGAGRPLPRAVRGWAEARTGEPFDDVRVHADDRAGRLAASMDARAYTVGRHVVFGHGAYRPGDATGRALIAHELGHVVQGSRVVRRQSMVDEAGSAGEARVVDFRITTIEGREGEIALAARITAPMTAAEFIPRLIDAWVAQVFPDGIPAEAREAVIREAVRKAGAGKILQPRGYFLPFTRAYYDDLVRAHGGRAIAEEGREGGEDVVEAGEGSGTGPTAGSVGATSAPGGTTGGTVGADEGTVGGEARLNGALAAIRALEPGVEPPEATAQRIAHQVTGLHLEDTETFRQVVEAVRETVPEALPALLMEIERRTRLFSDFAPLLRNSVEDTIAIVSAIENVGAFLDALLTAVTSKVQSSDAQVLAAKLGAVSLLNVVFPPPFLFGAVEGIYDELAGLAELPAQLVELYENFDQIVSTVEAIAAKLFTPEGQELAREFGTVAGTKLAAEITRLSRLNVFELTYELGKLLGPLLVEVVVAVFMPASIAGTVFRRMIGVVRRLMKVIPEVPASVKRFLRRTDADDAPELTTDVDVGEGVSTPEVPEASTPEAPTPEPVTPEAPEARPPEPRAATPEPETPEAPAHTTPEPSTPTPESVTPTPEPPASAVDTPETPRSTPETPSTAPPTPGRVPGIEDLGREAYIEHLKRTQPGIDPDKPGLQARDGRQLHVRDDGAVLYENPDGPRTPCFSCDPIYVREGGTGPWRRRPESEIPPSRRQGRAAPAAVNPVTAEQIARIRELAPPWLRNSRYWDELDRTLDTADARDLVIPALERFRDVEGFRTVLLNLLSGGTGRQGAQFVLRYALRHVDDAGEVVFESRRRVGVLDPDAAPDERWSALGRDVDVLLRGPGVRVELKSWGPDWIRQKLIDDPSYLHRQLALDLAESQDPREVRWVFDARRLLKEPTRTRRVLDIPEGTDLTPAVLKRAIADKFRASLSTELAPTTHTGMLSEMMRITGGGILDDIVQVE